MKLQFTTKVGICLLGLSGASQMIAQVPLFQPIGIAADATPRVLVSAPYCESQGAAQVPAVQRAIYNVVSGAAVKYVALPSSNTVLGEDCVEVYLTISSGLAGFTAGDVFATFGNQVLQIHGTNAPTVFATSIPGAADHAGITFDRAGTFGYNLVVTGEDGTINIINHLGAIVQTLSPTLLPPVIFPVVALEGPQVAPLSFGKYGGYLWLMGEASQKIYAVSPVDHSTVELPTAFPTTTPPNSPESIQFVPPFICSVSIGGAKASYFDAFFPSGSTLDNTVRFLDLTTLGLSNFGILNEEFSGLVNPIDSNGNLIGGGVPLSNPPPQQEGTSLVTPRTDTPSCPVTTGCVLTQGGYKNHYNSKVLNAPLGGLTLGTVFYTNAQVNSIIQNNAVGGNGLISLAHQLVTAQLNIEYGALASPQVAAAIAQANALIGSLVVPPIGTGYLAPSVESAVENVLNNFNNGLMGPTACP